jgi:hypothetical protein
VVDDDDSDPTRYATDAIEEALYLHRRSLFGAISVAFFDTTSLYFEGHGGATLGQRGHPRTSVRNLPRSCWALWWINRIGPP